MLSADEMLKTQKQLPCPHQLHVPTLLEAWPPRALLFLGSVIAMTAVGRHCGHTLALSLVCSWVKSP